MEKKKQRRKSQLRKGWAVIHGGNGPWAIQSLSAFESRVEAVREQKVGEEVCEIEFRLIKS